MYQIPRFLKFQYLKNGSRHKGIEVTYYFQYFQLFGPGTYKTAKKTVTLKSGYVAIVSEGITLLLGRSSQEERIYYDGYGSP